MNTAELVKELAARLTKKNAAKNKDHKALSTGAKIVIKKTDQPNSMSYINGCACM